MYEADLTDLTPFQSTQLSVGQQEIRVEPVVKNRYISKHLYIMKKVNIFCFISESETHILYRFITHRVTYFKPLFLEICMIMATDNENPKFSVSENLNIT